MKRFLLGGLAAISLLVSQASAETLIRFGFPGVGADNRQYSLGDTSTYARAREIIEKEFANDKDVKISWTFFRGAGPALNESYAAGQLDFFLLGDLPAIVGRSRGLDYKFIFASSRRVPIYLAVNPASGINSIEDLKGKKVAVFKGTNLQIATDHVLAAHGFAEKDLRFVSLDASAGVSALASGNVDAVFGGPEFLTVAKKGVVKIVYSTKGDDPKLGRTSSYLVSPAFEKAHPDLVQRVVTTLIKTAQFASIDANQNEIFEGWSLSGFPKETFEEDIAGDKLSYRLNPLIDDYIVARYKEQAAAAKSYGLIKTDVDVDSWFERKYLDQALKDLHLEHFWSTYDANGKIETVGEIDKKVSN